MKKQNNYKQFQVDSIKPLFFKFYNSIDSKRIVLYREDFRQIVDLKPHKHIIKEYVIEISRSRYKLYITALKIPKKYSELIKTGRGIYHLAASSKAKVYYLDMTEKQGKKLIHQCQNNFRQVLDMLYI